ncbi:MAG: hypothetical protein LBB93_01745, partial [Elusimicrobiota bacterium]|nr:hypothetical protein [Elusimicrobiota bacterium]
MINNKKQEAKQQNNKITTTRRLAVAVAVAVRRGFSLIPAVRRSPLRLSFAVVVPFLSLLFPFFPFRSLVPRVERPSKAKTHLISVILITIALLVGGAYFQKANADVDVSSFPGLKTYLEDSFDYSGSNNIIKLTNDIVFVHWSQDDPDMITFGDANKTVDGQRSGSEDNFKLTISGYDWAEGGIMRWAKDVSNKTVTFTSITFDIFDNNQIDTVFSVKSDNTANEGSNFILNFENTKMD